MPNAELFTDLTNLVDVDPFALLGISVSADEKRIAKRYRHIAKQLHPDALSSDDDDSAGLTPALATQIIARIVNPAYQKLKHEKSRQETITLLRLRVRRLVRTEKLVPTFPDAQQLENIAEEEVEVFYEQAMSQLAATQFRSMGDLHTRSLEIGQLNLIYLRRKMQDIVIRPKRAGLITNTVKPTGATIGSTSAYAAAALQQQQASGPLSGGVSTTPAQTKAEEEIDYAAKHTKRAKTYLTQKNYDQAVQELRDALKLTPQNPELHSMLGQAYYKQQLSGMAKAHFRRALKLKPNHKVAQKYGKLLGLSEDEPKAKNLSSEQVLPTTS
ncbi:MAG: tetratricopeptide repeat protein, partial [Cyanobacteria bacterium P01_C01_bin.121]